MKIRLVVSFLLASFINVKVSALQFEVPAKCSNKKTSRCSLFTDSEIHKMQLTGGEVRAARGTSLTREAQNKVTLIRGNLHVRANQSIEVNTLYGRVYINGGDAIVVASDSVVKFFNLSAETEYQPRGEDKAHTLPKGFSNYFAGIKPMGVAETGYPKLAEVDSLLASWKTVYGRSEIQSFKSDVRDFMPIWRAAKVTMTNWYVDTVQREIASAEAEHERLARLKSAREKENKKYRQMFKSRIYSEE